MYKPLKFSIFLFLFITVTIPSSLCAGSDSGPNIAGVYDIPQHFQRTLNYKGSNTLHCNVTGTFKPEDYAVQWFREELNTQKQIDPKEDDPHFEIKDNDLIIKNVNDDLLKDKYTCSLVLKSANRAVASANFFLLGKLSVKIVSPGTFIQGQKIELECQTQGYPSPQIEWRYENQTFIHTLGRFKLRDNLEKGLASYYLQIDQAELTDRGEYACRATNEHMNTTDAVIYVRVKDKFAALWPFIGICAEVVVLCAIIFVYERKRNKAELDESDTDQSPEQKNTPDHGKESVRQRK